MPVHLSPPLHTNPIATAKALEARKLPSVEILAHCSGATVDVGMSLTSPPNGPELCRAGTFFLMGSFVFRPPLNKERRMNELIYLIGVILAVLSFFGLR